MQTTITNTATTATTLHTTILRYANLIAVCYTITHYTTLHELQLQLQLGYFTLTALGYATLSPIPLHNTPCTTAHATPTKQL